MNDPINRVTVLCLAALVGCSNPMKRADLTSVDTPENNEANVSLVSATETQQRRNRDATETQPTTFLDANELQYGTGRMDSNADPEFRMTATGLRYRVLRKTTGRKPTARNKVTVHYRGWLDNGREFDSSYDRGEPISFPLNGVVKGWTEGMQLVGEGGMIELWLPSRLGYGAQGSPPSVPPYASLHFIVELVKVQ